MSLFSRLRFNLFYFGKAPWDTGVSPPELLEFIKTHTPHTGRAIDIGCGTGTNVITLAKAGWKTSGIDFAPRAIQIAKRKIKKENLHADLFVDDATRMKHITGQFDFALDMGCFHGIETKANYLTQLSKILNPNSFWLMYGFYKPDPLLSGPGLAPIDLETIAAQKLTLLSRQNGFDKSNRPSAWFLYQKI